MRCSTALHQSLQLHKVNYLDKTHLARTDTARLPYRFRCPASTAEMFPGCWSSLLLRTPVGPARVQKNLTSITVNIPVSCCRSTEVLPMNSSTDLCAGINKS